MFSPRLFLGSAVLMCCCVIAACGSSSPTSDQSGGRGQVTTVTAPPQTVVETVTTPTQTTTTGTTTTGTTTTGTTTTGTSTTSTTGGSSIPPSASGGSTECVAADLKPSFLGTNGAAGTIAVGFALTNISSSTCTTYGWPGVLLLSSTDQALPTNAVRSSSDLLGSTPASNISLAPGQKASFRMIASDFASGNTASCPDATDLQIIAPNDTATLKVAISGGIPACGRATLSPMMVGTSAWPTQ
jgi:hypothetical protein